MNQANKPGRHSIHLSASGWLLILSPILLALVAAAALIAVGTLFTWSTVSLLFASLSAAFLGMLAATVLLYGQAKGRQVGRKTLSDLEVRMSSILESAMDPIITTDGAQRVVLFNRAAETVFRWPRQAVVGQHLDMLIPERFRDTHHRHVGYFGETGATSRRMGENIVLKGLRADGQEFPIEASISQHLEGNERYYTVILRDVTQRVAAEEALARSEATLRGILDSAMDAIITVDQSQHIVMFNQAAESVFGCSRAQAIGAPLSWLIPDRYRADHSEYIRRFGDTRVNARRMGSAQRVVTGLRSDGQEFPIDASISQITQEGGKYYTVILRDVTERMQADQALRKSREDLQEMALAAHTVREQEKTKIARELHDELGQALTAMKMDVAWLQDISDKPAVVAKLEEMEAMVSRTIASTRRISSELRPLILDDLGLAAAIEWLTQNFSERTGVSCNLEVSDPEPDLHDPLASAVFRIVQESLTNIAKHAKASEVIVELKVDQNTVLVKITDDGVGFVTDNPRKPHSYGLLGLRERAYLLGGNVAIRSEPGRGTGIEVSIPLRQEMLS